MPRLQGLLGRQIAHFRRRAKLTQEQLAEKTRYSVDFIGLVERGVHAPTVARLQDIAKVLKVEPWRLFHPTGGDKTGPSDNPQKDVPSPKRAGTGKDAMN